MEDKGRGNRGGGGRLPKHSLHSVHGVSRGTREIYYELSSKAHWSQPELRPSTLSVHDSPPQHVIFEAIERIRLGQHTQQDRQSDKSMYHSKKFHTESLISHKKQRETLHLTWTEILVLCIKPLTAIASHLML